MITTKDGTQIYYKDGGKGQPVVSGHGWSLSADAGEDQMFFLASRGYRCIAHDRRGHGRSSQPWAGNDLDTHADDQAALVEALGAGMIGRRSYYERWIAAFLALKMLFREVKGNWAGRPWFGFLGSTNKFQIV